MTSAVHRIESALRGLRATRAEVDLDALSGNIRALKSRRPATTTFMAVIKANAYGHGSVPVARAFLDAGATHLAVATVGEGRRLRAHRITAPIMILGSIDPWEADEAVALNIDLAIATHDLYDAVLAAAIEQGKQARIHVKVDTGLKRYGAPPEIATELARRAMNDETIQFVGLFTHFASSDEADPAFTLDQHAKLRKLQDAWAAEGIRPEDVHCCNSGATVWSDFDGMVRPGMIMYGVPPSDDIPLLPSMRPALTLRSRVQRTFVVESGESVGYNRTWFSDRRRQAALIPVGYADGYRRELSSKGWVDISGHRCDVLGRVSMDQIVVGIPDEADVTVGTEVIVMGGDGSSAAPTIEQVARLVGTNPYEILTGITARVPRVYRRGGAVVEIEDLLA